MEQARPSPKIRGKEKQVTWQMSHPPFRVEIVFRPSVNRHEAVNKPTLTEADQYATHYINENGWRGAIGYTITHNGRRVVTFRYGNAEQVRSTQ
jgi:hypothetical protein